MIVRHEMYLLPGILRTRPLQHLARLLFFATFAVTAGCAEAPKAKLAQVDALVDKYIKEDKVAGIVVVVYRRNTC